jgi:hypothetical protein
MVGISSNTANSVSFRSECLQEPQKLSISIGNSLSFSLFFLALPLWKLLVNVKFYRAIRDMPYLPGILTASLMKRNKILNFWWSLNLLVTEIELIVSHTVNTAAIDYPIHQIQRMDSRLLPIDGHPSRQNSRYILPKRHFLHV